MAEAPVFESPLVEIPAPVLPSVPALPVDPPSGDPRNPQGSPEADPAPSGSVDHAAQERVVLVPALAVVVALLLGLTGFLGWRVADTSGPAPVEASRSDALQAARNAATLVFSYDYRHLDKDFAAGRAVTTGAFQKEYTSTTTKVVTGTAAKYKAVVIAAVSEASVVEASENRVVALVFVNQQSSSTLAAAPKVTQSRLELTLVHRGGAWLVSTIKAL